jgi:hypothetical protein
MRREARREERRERREEERREERGDNKNKKNLFQLIGGQGESSYFLQSFVNKSPGLKT